MRSPAVLAVVLLLVLAGCNGPLGGGGTTAETTTDAGETDSAGANLPPGLSASGVTDPEMLVDAHASALNDTSYTVESNVTARDGETTVARSNATVRVDTGGLPRFQRYDVGGERPGAVGLYPYEVESWTDENGTWYATDGPNGTTYRQMPDERGRSGAPSGRDHLSALFAALNTTVAGTETRDGTTLHRVNATGVADAERLASTLRGDAVENVSLTALVGEDGVVHRYRVAYDATFENETARIERTVRFGALGGTTVERPAWYDQAVNATEERA